MSPRTYVVRTFGCQMNEHDSERIAGLLASEGMEATDDVESADVVVLNTCCIRENADNKLYGQLGRLKSLKQERPDLQIAVGGCLAQKDRELIVERAGLVRREPDPDDKRAAFAVITDDGRAALRKAAPVYLQGIEEEFLSHLTAGERKALERSLHKVLDAHSREADGPIAPTGP